jgi:hypothetical protein
MSSITVEQYSEKAIVVRGNTIQYKEKLLSIGGKWNKMLKGGEGWIFPLTKKPVVEKALSEQPSVYENDSSDNTYKSTDRKYEKRTSHDNVSEVVLTKKEYLHLISRIERLEQLVARFSDNDEPQKEQKEQKEQKKRKDKKSKLPPPLSSISDSDLHDPINYDDNIEYNSDNSDSERQPVQRLLRKKNNL